MDRELIESKLEALRQFVRRIRDKTPTSVRTLSGDADLQDIISVNLERAVQVCVDIAAHIIADSEEAPPATMGASFDALQRLGVLPAELALQLKRAVGFRNIAVHTYQDIDWSVVFEIVTTRLDDFGRFAGCVAATLSSEEDS